MFVKTNNEISYTATDIEAMKEIPVGNWLLKFNTMKGYYLESTPDFKFPKKIYGDAEKLAKRYLNTFNSVDGNVGVLLTGTKGTGKSVTAKMTAYLSDLAVIIITEPFCDENFKSFLSNISQKCVVFVDEFEKVYFDVNQQNNFLSILDGVFEGKKLFLFTSNEKSRVNQYMLNRPGRIHYLGEYDSLSEEIIEDVIKDTLNNKEHKVGLLEVLNILGTVTMDILMSLIKEMNMYEESAKEAVKYLNLKPESNSYDVEVLQGAVILGTTTLGFHPLTNEEFNIEFYCSDSSKYIKPKEEVVVVDDWSKVKPVIDHSGEIHEQKEAEKSVSEWLYLTINIPESKVSHKGKKIVIDSDNNMRYVFTKKNTYYYAF